MSSRSDRGYRDVRDRDYKSQQYGDIRDQRSSRQDSRKSYDDYRDKRDRETRRSRSRERQRSRSKERNRSRSRERQRDRGSDKQKPREVTRERDRSKDRRNSPLKAKTTELKRDEKSTKQSNTESKSFTTLTSVGVSSQTNIHNTNNIHNTSIQLNNYKQHSDDEKIDEEDIEALEAFMINEEVENKDEDEEERLILERKKRREEIMKRHNMMTTTTTTSIASKTTTTTTDTKTATNSMKDPLISDKVIMNETVTGSSSSSSVEMTTTKVQPLQLQHNDTMKSDTNATTSTINSVTLTSSIPIKNDDITHTIHNTHSSSSSSFNMMVVDTENSNPSWPVTTTTTTSRIKSSDQEDDTFLQLKAEKDALEAENQTTRQYTTTFDIFSSSPSDIEKLKNNIPGGSGGKPMMKTGSALNLIKTATASHIDHGDNQPYQALDYDDNEGYYKARIGEIIHHRYRTLGIVGKGVFSTVLKCADMSKEIDMDNLDNTNKSGTNINSGNTANSSMEMKYESVAIKLIRNNDVMRKAADKEHQILLLLTKHDTMNKKHCIKLLDKFEYHQHTAFVFEFLNMNLRETLKKFGKDVGINIGAIRLYMRQLLIALKLLYDLKIVHADIKLDNILCSADLKQVKLCDFGSAFFETDSDNVPTPYLQSRFYRAPEVILGQPYDHQIDLWSVGVSCYELFTGHVMFPGRTNNEMLKLIMAVKGRFSTKQIKLHLRQYESMNRDPHFEGDNRFKQYDIDTVSGKVSLKLVEVPNNPTKELISILRSAKAGADDTRLVTQFTQLLEQCLILDPSKRITVQEALKHPFFTMK